MTHFTVTLSWTNTSGPVGNPTNTTYQITTTGNGAPGPTNVVYTPGNGPGVAGNPSDVMTKKFTGLQDNTAYTFTICVLNQNAGWNNSVNCVSKSTTTLSLNAVYSVSDVNVTSAAFTANVGNPLGLTNYQFQACPRAPAVGGCITDVKQPWPQLAGNNLNVVSDTFTTPSTVLSPDTPYAFHIQYFENTDASAESPAPDGASNEATTTPSDPTSFLLTVPASTGTLHASWTLPSVPAANPSYTTYRVFYCAGDPTVSCGVSKDVPNNGAAADLGGLLEETTYYARVKAVSVGGGSDSDFSNIAFAETRNQGPILPNAPSCSAGSGATFVCTVTGVQDNDLTDGVGVVYNWTVTPATDVASINQYNGQSFSAVNTATVTYISATTPYNVTVTVTDHDGNIDGKGLSASKSTVFNPSQIPTTISILPSLATVGVGQKSPTFTATVKDQNNNIIPNASVNWTISAVAGIVSPTPSPTTVFTAGSAPGSLGTFTLTASLNPAPPATASITVATNTITIAPANTTAVTGNQVTYSATVVDPNQNSITPTLTWAASGGGTMNPNSGVFTAQLPGPFTITATDVFGDSATTSITILAAGPQFVGTPSITLNADLMTATLTAAGDDNVPPHQVTVDWSLESGPAAPIFGNNDATSTSGSLVTASAKFTQVGTYIIRCTLRNGNGSNFQDIPSPGLVVPQNLTTVKVGPDNVTIQTFQNQVFTATGFDQFGSVLNSQPTFTWTEGGASGGSISGSGAAATFTSAQVGVTYIVTAQAANLLGQTVKGSATATAVSFDVSGAHAYPNPYKSTMGTGVINFTGLGSSASLRIFTISGREVFSVQTNQDTYPWTITNTSGEKVASGVYFFRVDSPNASKTGKLIIIQ